MSSTRLDAVEGKLRAIEAEGKEISVKTKEARDAFLAVKKKRYVKRLVLL